MDKPNFNTAISKLEYAIKEKLQDRFQNIDTKLWSAQVAQVNSRRTQNSKLVQLRHLDISVVSKTRVNINDLLYETRNINIGKFFNNTDTENIHVLFKVKRFNVQG